MYETKDFDSYDEAQEYLNLSDKEMIEYFDLDLEDPIFDYQLEQAERRVD